MVFKNFQQPIRQFWLSASKMQFLCINLIYNVDWHLIHDCFEVSEQTNMSESLKIESTAKIVTDLALKY